MGKVKVFKDRTEWRNSESLLHRLDGPAIEYSDGAKAWWVNGQLHRVDGPAIEYNNGTKEWYVNGQLHRVDGPAIECRGGYKEWWIEGQELTEDEFNMVVGQD